MKKIIILSLFALFTYSANSQQMQFGWVAQAGGPEWDIVTDMAELESGQLIIAGAYYKSISFPGTILESSGSRDVFIASYNPDGSFNQAISLGGKGYDYVKKIQPSGAGFVAPISFNHSLKIGGQEFKGQSRSNLLLAWFDGSFNLTDYAQVSCTGEFDITTLETAPDGDFYFSGYFTDTLIVDKKVYASKDTEDIFLGKISNKGKLKWLNHYEGDGSDKTSSFVPENDDINYMAGITHKGCFNSKLSPEARTDSLPALFLTYINNTGKELLVDYPLFGNSIEPVKILKDSSNIWILANFKYIAKFKDGVEILSYGKSDALLLKYDIEKQSYKYCQLGGFGNEQATGMVKSGTQVIITGLFTGTLSFAGEKVVAKPKGTDVFIATVNDDCSPTGIRSLSGESSEFPCAAYATGSGIYIAGEFKGKLNTGNGELTSMGKEDIFLARVENCGAKNPLSVEYTQLGNEISPSWELDAGEGFVGYSWDGEKSASRYYTVLEPGSYSVEVTDTLGCVYSQQVVIPGAKSAKIDKENTPGQEFSLYPTITSNLVFWKPSTDWPQTQTIVRVADISGRQIIRQEIDKLNYQTYQLDFTGEAEGTYVIEISGDGFSKTSQIIVKR